MSACALFSLWKGVAMWGLEKRRREISEETHLMVELEPGLMIELVV